MYDRFIISAVLALKCLRYVHENFGSDPDSLMSFNTFSQVMGGFAILVNLIGMVGNILSLITWLDARIRGENQNLHLVPNPNLYLSWLAIVDFVACFVNFFSDILRFTSKPSQTKLHGEGFDNDEYFILDGTNHFPFKGYTFFSTSWQIVNVASLYITVCLCLGNFRYCSKPGADLVVVAIFSAVYSVFIVHVASSSSSLEVICQDMSKVAPSSSSSDYPSEDGSLEAEKLDLSRCLSLCGKSSSNPSSTLFGITLEMAHPIVCYIVPYVLLLCSAFYLLHSAWVARSQKAAAERSISDLLTSLLVPSVAFMTFLSLTPALVLLMSIGWPNTLSIGIDDIDEAPETFFLLAKVSFIFFQKINAAFKIILYLIFSNKFRQVLRSKFMLGQGSDKARGTLHDNPEENVNPQQNVEEEVAAETRKGSSWWPLMLTSAPETKQATPEPKEATPDTSNVKQQAPGGSSLLTA